jgi:hypothetical protein
MTKDELFSELSIKISILDMKLDKVLNLLNQPPEETKPKEFSTLAEWDELYK